MIRLRPRAWRDLFPSLEPDDAAGWLAELEAAPDAPGDLWPQLARAADPKFERPRARRQVETETLDQGRGVIISDGASGTYVHLAPEDLFLWERMDGTRNQIDLVVDFCLKFKALAPARVAGLVELLRTEGLLSEPPDMLYSKLQDRLVRGTFVGRVTYISQTFLQREFAISGVNGLLNRLYRGGVRWLFTRPAQIVFWLIAALGLGVFGYLAASRQFSVLGDGAVVEGGLALFVFTIVALVLHEAAHAFTVISFGRRVHRAGFFILMGLIGAFVDTTDIWPAGKRAQLWVTWAGPFVNLVLGGAAALLIAANPAALYAPLAFQFAVSQYGIVLLNLTPFLRLDGYYLLSDALEVPNLSSRSTGFLRKVLPRRLRQAWAEGRWLPALNREEKILVAFGALSALWIANLLGLGVLVAPVRLVETAGKLLTGGFAGASPITILFALVGLVFTLTLLVRAVQGVRGWLQGLSRSLLTASGWQTAMVLGGLAAGVAAVPDVLIAQGSARVVETGLIYAHAIVLAASALLALYASRLWRDLYGAGLRIVFGGLAVTGAALAAVEAASLASAALPWPLLRLAALLPAVLCAAWAAPLIVKLRGASLGWSVVLAGLGLAALVAAASPAAGGHFWSAAGHSLLAASVLLCWQLTRRPLGPPRVPAVVEAAEPAGILRQAAQAVARELTQSLGEMSGQKAVRDLAFQFNNRLADTDWPIWLTMKGSLGEKFSGTLEQRAGMYRAALDELVSQISARLGRGFAEGARAQALAELPAPLRAAYRRWLAAGAAPASTTASEAEIDDDRIRLRLAGRRLAETVVMGCGRSFGWRLTDTAIGQFNRAAAAANWPLYIRGNGRLADDLGGDLLSIAQIYGEALQDLLGRVAAVAGTAFVERGVVQVFDHLPWEAREVSLQLLFQPLSWARRLQPARADNPRLTFLRAVPLLSWMPPDELAALNQRLEPRMVKAGSVVLTAETYLDRAIIVRQGSLQAITTTSGVRRVVEQLGAGSLVGVRSILANRPAPFTYLAQTDCELWLVPADYVARRLTPLLHLQDALDDQQATLALLARNPLFAALDAAQRQAVAQALQAQRLPPETVIVQQGQASQGFYIVQKGELEVLVTGADGSQRRVSTLGAGEFFGEAALLKGTPITATVRARTEVELLRLPPANFQALVAAGLGASLSQVDSRRSKERQRIAQVVNAPAEAQAQGVA